MKSPAVLEQLREEAEARSAKKKSALKKPKKSLHFDKQKNNSDVSEDEEIDQTRCIMCNRLWRKYNGKEQWLICDICDEYVCPKYVPDNTDLDDDFFGKCGKCTERTFKHFFLAGVIKSHLPCKILAIKQ